MLGNFQVYLKSSKLKWIRLIAIVLLVLGVSFRFAHLERKVYWHDETYTSMIITARPSPVLKRELFQNKLASPADLLAYTEYVPDLTLKDMLIQKGTSDVQHPPIYYVLLRFWTQLWGTDPIVTRGFSSFLSLLLFPALYWLCLELFNSHLSGWIAIGLFAVSPIHLIYAQEVREFGVWTGLTLINHALLLRAVRDSSWKNWMLYGMSMVISFYTALLSLYVAVGHFVYLLLIDSDNHFFKSPRQIGQRTMFCFVTLICVAVLFIPWLYFIVISRDMLNATTSWLSNPVPLMKGVNAIIFNFSSSFFDFNLTDAVAYVLAIPLLVLQGYVMYILWQTAPKRIWKFLFVTVGIPLVLVSIPDLMLGGRRFTVIRYIIPTLVGLQLAVVYVLSTYFGSPQQWKSRFAILLSSLLILLGVLSCHVYSQADTWSNKSLSSNYHQLADVINTSNDPLIIGDASRYYPVSLVSLSYLLKPNVQLLLLPPVEESLPIMEIPDNVQTIFLFNLSDQFRKQFQKQYQKTFTLSFEDPWNQVWETQN